MTSNASQNEVDAIADKHFIESFVGNAPCQPNFNLHSLNTLNETEDVHFWSAVKRYLVLRIIHRFIQKKDIAVMDIGCGNGGLLHYLERKMPGCRLTGVDAYLEALINCRRRSRKSRLILQNIGSLAENQTMESYDVITVLDVIEHLDDPVHMLNNLKSFVKKDGIIIVTVPAFQVLWSERDVFLGHRKRYSQGNLINVLRNAGFLIIHSNYFFPSLFLPTFLHRKILSPLLMKDGKTIEDNELHVVPVINSILKYFGYMEVLISLVSPIPIGTSVYCVGKPKSI